MAIAFDAISAVTAVSATTATYSHTTSGDDRILFVCYHGDNGDSDLITGVTYNGVSMTKVGSSVKGDRWIGVYYLINPAVGTNDVVVTSDPADTIRTFAVSYTGANQDSQVDSYNSGTNSATDGISLSTTVVEDNAWTAMFLKDNSGIQTYSGETMRLASDAGGQAFCDSNGGVSSGSNSLSVTSGDLIIHVGIIFSIKPVAPTTNIKSINGVAYADIKSINGVAIADIKSFNGLE